MTILIRYFALTGLILFFCACGRYTERRWAQETIAIAETLLERQPDSALYLLQSIPSVAVLPEEQQMTYRLCLLQAKDKCVLNITADTNIVEVLHYFKQREDRQKTALAAFYTARVWQERKNSPQAINTYLDAEIYASRTGDNKLKGMIQHNIGGLYYNQLAFQKSIAAHKKAAGYFRQIDSTVYPYMVFTYQALSGNYIAMKQWDSALYYNDKGLSLAQSYCDTTLLSSVYQSRAIIYREKGKLLEAKKCLDRVFQYSPDERYRSQLYITLIKFYKETKQTDLAVSYAEKSLQLFDSIANSENLRATVYYLLSAIAQEQGNYRKALSYYTQYSDLLIKIYHDVQNSSILGLREKYDLAMMDNNHQQLVIQTQQKNRQLLWLLIVLILTGFAFYYYHTYKKTILLEVEQQMAQLKIMVANYDDKDKTLKSTLLRSFDIAKKLSLLEVTLNREEKKSGAKLLRRFKEIVFGVSDGNYWKCFYPTINNYYNGRLDVLKDCYPSLSEMEFKVCCLSLADFRNNEMAIFMNCSESTIRAKKTSIRKKAGIPQGGDLARYLAQHL
jgi:tetratricopeptide (TPR) repeat protein